MALTPPERNQLVEELAAAFEKLIERMTQDLSTDDRASVVLVVLAGKVGRYIVTCTEPRSVLDAFVNAISPATADLFEDEEE